jgi:rhamnulokinase
MTEKAYLAIDIGASSGRHLIGRFDGKRLALQEVYRFENGPVDILGHQHWDFLGQWTDIKKGVRAASELDVEIASLGVDTWGVDFGLIGPGNTLLGNPYHYRDTRTNGILEKAFEIVPRKTIFQKTGLQFMQFNTLFQLLAMKLNNSAILDSAESLLMMPDLFHWLLSGLKSNEMTNATTSQCYNPIVGDWATDLLEMFGLPTGLFGPISQPGTILGPMRSGLGLKANVVLPGSHDTASAIMAVPTVSKVGSRPDWCYLSLGTWALMGIESPHPVVTDEVAQLNFTNEGGVGGTTRLLKNICGLWLIQQCRAKWNQQGNDLDWEDLNRLSAAAEPRRSFIDPDSSDFLSPNDMPEAIRSFCRRTNQEVPESKGAVIRCAIDSLALKFRHILSRLEMLGGGAIQTIHIVGGGTKNRQLCQATADACGRPVVAGPVEATATGNLLVQAIAAGDIGSIDQAREVVRNSFPVEQLEPRENKAWEEAYGQFIELLENH